MRATKRHFSTSRDAQYRAVVKFAFCFEVFWTELVIIQAWCYGMAWHGMYGMVWQGMTWHGMVWHGGMVLYGVICVYV